MKIITNNKRASFDYSLLEKFEAGIVLVGTEIKSIREGKIRIEESFVMFSHGEAFLHNMTIPHYSHGNINNHDETRTRKLLLNRSEISKIEEKCKKDSLSVVVTKLYLKDGKAKLEIALAKGKKLYDKRESDKNKDTQKYLRKGQF